MIFLVLSISASESYSDMFEDISLGFGYLPVLWGLFTSFTFILCYGIAVSKNHIYPFIPAISDTGAQIPEANIFSEFFNFSIVLMTLSLIVRYLQFEMLSRGFDSTEFLLNRLNKVALGCGLVSAFGGTLIANFPSKEEDNMIYVHDTGAVLLFGSGALYCWAQCYLTYKLTQQGLNSPFLFTIRFILTCVITVFGTIFFVAELFAYEEFRHQSLHTVAKWEPSDPGYSVHVLSNVGEWIAGFCFGLFGITFFEEFQRISLHVECTLKSPQEYQTTPLLNCTDRHCGDDEE